MSEDKSSLPSYTKSRAGSRRHPRTAVACTNCNISKRRCDNQRPCGRCVRLGKGDTCTSLTSSSPLSLTRNTDATSTTPPIKETIEVEDPTPSVPLLQMNFFRIQQLLEIDTDLTDSLSEWHEDISPFTFNDLIVKYPCQWRFFLFSISWALGKDVAMQTKRILVERIVKIPADRTSEELLTIGHRFDQSLDQLWSSNVKISAVVTTDTIKVKEEEEEEKKLENVASMAVTYVWKNPLTITFTFDQKMLELLGMTDIECQSLFLEDQYTLIPLLWIFLPKSWSDVIQCQFRAAVLSKSIQKQQFSLANVNGEEKIIDGMIHSHLEDESISRQIIYFPVKDKQETGIKE